MCLWVTGQHLHQFPAMQESPHREKTSGAEASATSPPTVKLSPLTATCPVRLQPWRSHWGPIHTIVGKGSWHRDNAYAKNSNSSLREGGHHQVIRSAVRISLHRKHETALLPMQSPATPLQRVPSPSHWQMASSASLSQELSLTTCQPPPRSHFLSS